MERGDRSFAAGGLSVSNKGGGSFRNGGTRIGESIVMEGGVGIEGGSRNGEGIVMELSLIHI